MNFKAICWRYGELIVHEYDEKGEAYRQAQSLADMGEHYFECLLDANDVIIFDNTNERRNGEKYILEG